MVRRRLIIAVIALALLGAGAAYFLRATTTSGGPEQVTPPWDVTDPAWDSLLIGDASLTEDTYTRLADVHTGLNLEQARTAAEVAVAVAEAELTAQNQQAWPGYWPPVPTTRTPVQPRCTDVRILAASPIAFPVTGTQRSPVLHVKALVPYAAECGQDIYTPAAPGIEYVYLRSENGTEFQPIRSWNIPAAEPNATTATLEEWQLAPIGPCGLVDTTTYKARTIVAAAFAQMCAAAADDDVVLVVESAYRTPQQQRELFEEATEFYGTAELAREWVAFSDGDTCESKHCTGTAVSIEPDNAAITWLNTVVGCGINQGGQLTLVSPTEGGCAVGAEVTQAQLYGFVAPVARIPGYLEFVLATGDDTATPPDCTPAGVSVDKMIASIFRCRLARANIGPAVAETVVAEALVVARCASEWNSAAQVFAGRYATTPNPEDGRYYTEAGVFGLRSELAESGWLTGDVHDPVANINAAASLWLATRGWEQFACATGTDPGLDAGPVLERYGGPTLPAWATAY